MHDPEHRGLPLEPVKNKKNVRDGFKVTDKKTNFDVGEKETGRSSNNRVACELEGKNYLQRKGLFVCLFLMVLRTLEEVRQGLPRPQDRFSHTPYSPNKNDNILKLQFFLSPRLDDDGVEVPDDSEIVNEFPLTLPD